MTSLTSGESRMVELEEMRHKEEKRMARKEAMISNIREMLNHSRRATALSSLTDRQYYETITELERSIDQVRLSIWYIDAEMEDLDRSEYGGPGS